MTRVFGELGFGEMGHNRLHSGHIITLAMHIVTKLHLHSNMGDSVFICIQAKSASTPY